MSTCLNNLKLFIWQIYLFQFLISIISKQLFSFINEINIPYIWKTAQLTLKLENKLLCPIFHHRKDSNLRCNYNFLMFVLCQLVHKINEDDCRVVEDRIWRFTFYKFINIIFASFFRVVGYEMTPFAKSKGCSMLWESKAAVIVKWFAI